MYTTLIFVILALFLLFIAFGFYIIYLLIKKAVKNGVLEALEEFYSDEE